MRVQEAVVECAFVGNTSMRRLQSHLLEVALPVLVLAGIEGGKLFTMGKPFPHLCGEIKVKGNHLTFMCAPAMDRAEQLCPWSVQVMHTVHSTQLLVWPTVLLL